MPSGSGWITWRRMTFVVPVLGSATVPEANSNRFNSCSVTPQSKRRNGTSGADRSSKMRSTIGSKYHWQVGRDNPVYHVRQRIDNALNHSLPAVCSRLACRHTIRWVIARIAAHRDDDPGASVRLTRNGKLLLICAGNCVTMSPSNTAPDYN